MNNNEESALCGVFWWELEPDAEQTFRVRCAFLMDVKCLYVIRGLSQPINLPVTSNMLSSKAEGTSLHWRVI